jgi:RNA ligase (TIGR02306 family)
VVKYEPPLPPSREELAPFPGRVPKTDEIRLQSALAVLDELRGREFFVTTKCDGTSSTYLRDGEAGRVECSRNWAIARSDHQVWRIAAQYELEQKLPPDFAIQGEICGPGVQKNRLGLAAHELFVFSVYDVRAARFLDYEPFVAFCAEHRLRTVPIERVVRGADAAAYEHTLESWLEAARGLYPGTKQRKEGIVVRPLVEAPSAALEGRLSFKVINNDFLLKDED